MSYSEQKQRPSGSVTDDGQFIIMNDWGMKLCSVAIDSPVALDVLFDYAKNCYRLGYEAGQHDLLDDMMNSVHYKRTYK